MSKKKDLGEPKQRIRRVKGKSRREYVYPVECPRCGNTRWLKKADAEKAIETEAPCLRCSLSEKGKRGWATTVSRHGILVAIKAQQKYRLAHPSCLEGEVIHLLEQNQIPYKREVLVEGQYRNFLVDFVIPLSNQNLAIEVNGNYVHSFHTLRDAEKVKNLQHEGFKVLVITEDEIKAKLAEAKILAAIANA
jgi:very-short-patch-repair endonuclease